MIKITADDKGNVSIEIDGNNSSKLFAVFGCIVLAFMKMMKEKGVDNVAMRTLHMVEIAASNFIREEIRND